MLSWCHFWSLTASPKSSLNILPNIIRSWLWCVFGEKWVEEKSATSLISRLIAAGSSLCVSVNSISLACVRLTDAFCCQTNAFFRFYTPLVTDACRYGNIVHLYITPEIRSLVKLIIAYCFSCQTEEGWKCFGVIMGTHCLSCCVAKLKSTVMDFACQNMYWWKDPFGLWWGIYKAGLPWLWWGREDILEMHEVLRQCTSNMVTLKETLSQESRASSFSRGYGSCMNFILDLLLFIFKI